MHPALRRGALALLLGAAVTAARVPAAAAQAKDKNAVVTEMSVDDLEKLVAGMGFDVSRTEKGEGITFRLNDYAVVLMANGSNAQFATWFDRKGLKKNRASIEHMNRWNTEKRFSRAYIDKDGDPTLEYDVDFEGGVTPENVRVAVRTFRDVTTHFAAFLSD